MTTAPRRQLIIPAVPRSRCPLAISCCFVSTPKQASVESVPGAVDVLLAAGFEERGPDRLELGRQDTGLIWLAKSTLEACKDGLDGAYDDKNKNRKT